MDVKDVECEDVKVGGTMTVGRIQAEDVNVGGTLTVTGGAVVEGMTVGGTVSMNGGELEDARVGGTMESSGEVKFEGLDVGGRLRLESGSGKSVRVGGLLEVQHDLTLTGGLTVGGEARVDGKLRAESVNVGGGLRSDEVRASDSIKVGQGLLTSKGVKAEEVTVGRRGRVTGPIVGMRVHIESGSTAEDIYADELKIAESSSVRNVCAAKVEVGDSCRVDGRLLYTGEVRIGRGVQLSSQPEKVSTLPGPPL